MHTQPVEILCFGEPMFEFSWISADTIRPGIGGDVSNAAIAAARAGARVGMLTRLGTDSFADHITALYELEGIDTRLVSQDADAPTGIYFIEYGEDGHRFSYRRAGSAASRIGPDDLTADMFDGIGILHFSAITQAISNTSLEATLRAATLARAGGAKVSFDTNMRLNLWSIAEARAAVERTLPLVDYVFPSLEDCEALFDLSDPETICTRFLEAGVERVILTLGPDGALIADADGMQTIAPFTATLTDATGAGDTFDGAYLAETLRGAAAPDAARFACAAASLSVEKPGAVGSIPALDAIRERLKDRN